MAVYVDTLRKPSEEMKKQKKWHYPFFCHLTADTLDELNKFAFELGLRKDWVEGCPDNPHYNLVSNKRRMALEKGAMEKE